MRTVLSLLGTTIVLSAPALALAAPPMIAFTSPTSIDEGQSVTIEVTVTDPDPGDTPTWSWDTDTNGSFGEYPNATSYTVPAESTDGTRMLRIGVRATDGTETQTVYRDITVNNVAPTITSVPPTNAAVRREYRYDVTVEDPAGENDPIRYLLTSRPPGMEITGSTITWTPEPEHRGRNFPVILRVDDGDGGEDSQTWEVRVALNTPPTTATPTTPIDRARVPADMPVTLTVENASDEDGDPLTYFFQISRVVTFTPPDLFGSGEVAEGADGTTSWTTAEPLEPGLWYWQVWVSDGVVETPRRYAQFVVGDQMPAQPDGGLGDAGTIPVPDGGGPPPPPPTTGGCSVGANGSAGLPLALGFGLVAWIVRRRRR